MATKAEQAKAIEQRTGAAKAAKKKAKPAAKSAKRRGHTETKATYAREPRAADGKATRKSTRKSANRLKADSSYEIRDERKGSSSDARFRRDAAKTARVRGSVAK